MGFVLLLMILEKKNVRMTAEGISDAKLILYKKYGHNLIGVNRKQLQKDILKFLKN